MSTAKLRTFLIFLLASQLCMAADRPLAPWPPPDGPLRVIIDSDTANEVDDQFALALALGASDRLIIEGFVAAHFGDKGGRRGIDSSFDEMHKLLKLAGMAGDFPVKRGSDPVVYPDRVPESEGVEFIIDRARAATPDDPLWLVLLGPATDAAAALMKAPEIADRLVVFWHGRTRWPVQCWNFNAYNDIKAVQFIFATQCRLVLFDTGTYLRMPPGDMERRIAPISPLGEYLFQIRMAHDWTRSPRKGFFDLGDIAALVDPRAVEFEQVAAPHVDHDLDYDFSKNYGDIIRIFEVDRRRSFQMLEKALFVIERRAMR